MKTSGFFMTPIPQLGLNRTIPFQMTDDTVPSFTVALEQTIFDSGQSIARFQSARANVNVAEHTVFAHTQRRAVDLVRIYSDYYLARKRLDVAKQAAQAWGEAARAYEDLVESHPGDGRLWFRFVHRCRGSSGSR